LKTRKRGGEETRIVALFEKRKRGLGLTVSISSLATLRSRFIIIVAGATTRLLASTPL